MGQILFPSYFPCPFISKPFPGFSSINLEQLKDRMAVYWRVKRWKATITVTPGPNWDSQLPAGEYIQYGRWSANTEEELCCPQATEFINEPDYFGWESSYFLFSFLNQMPFINLSYNPADEGGVQAINSGGDMEITVENFTPSMTFTAIKSPNSSQSSIDLSMRAEEYWSYGGTYDTQTGQLLK